MVIDDLRWDFSKIHFWDTPVSACQIIGERISAISAMYCTAANELLFLGLPLNSVAVKLHVAREFSWAPAGRQEFREIVHQVNSQAAFQDADRITKFGFMNLLKREAKSRILQALPHNESGSADRVNAALRASSFDTDWVAGTCVEILSKAELLDV